MFKQLRLLNFKAWKDTGDVALKPVTLLLGVNSSGHACSSARCRARCSEPSIRALFTVAADGAVLPSPPARPSRPRRPGAGPPVRGKKPEAASPSLPGVAQDENVQARQIAGWVGQALGSGARSLGS